LENCAAWGRYSSPKAASADLNVRPMKKTILLLIIAQLSFAFIPGGNFKIILNSKIHIVHDTVGIWSGIENSYRLSDKGIKYVSDFKD